MSILQELNRKDGLTVVVTLHQVEYAMRYCPRTVALKAGQVVYDGPSSGLTRPMLVDIYGPEFEDMLSEGNAP
jgi:phosphonate transport system ATP-binding protein